MQQNHAIAVIIIVLFVVITGLSYGIYRLIQAGRAGNGTTTTGSESLADDDDSSLAPLVDPRFVPPVVPPAMPPQRGPGPRVRAPPVPPMVQIPPPRDGSVSPMEADPLAPRLPPNPPQPPPGPIVVQPLAPRPRPNATHRNPSRANAPPPAPPLIQPQPQHIPGMMPEEAPPEWGMPPELHGYAMPAELPGHDMRRRAVSPSGTLRRHARQRARPSLYGWLGGQMPAPRVPNPAPRNPFNPWLWDIPAW